MNGPVAARERREAEIAQTVEAALGAVSGRVLRTAVVVSVEPAGPGQTVYVDWDEADVDPVLAPCRANRDVVFAPGDTVLVVVIGRTPHVVCRFGGDVPQ